MKIGIVGGGAAGLFFAVFFSSRHPDWQIEIYEKEERVGRKLLATGNGHCNLLNEHPTPQQYSTVEVQRFFSSCGYPDLVDALAEQGIYLQKRKEGIYPITYSAASLLSHLLALLKRRRVALFTGFQVNGYQKTSIGIDVLFEHQAKRHVDFLAIATGGKSTPRLGSNGMFMDILKDHDYEIEDLMPALTPIKVKEAGLAPLKGLRHQASIKIQLEGDTLYEERGEILFKEDGLSGIVAFNCSSFLTWNNLWGKAVLLVDMFPDMETSCLRSLLDKSAPLTDRPLETILEKNLASYLSKRAGEERSGLPQVLKNLTFHPSQAYGFNDSQISHGGVLLREVDDHCRSLREGGVGLIGEALNVDGKCGGYNLTWALATAFLLANSFN